jgi:hypothetical protein
VDELSPAAQAVLDAAFCSCWESADLDKADIEVIAAAALRAAAAQVYFVADEDMLLAIAAELEGSDG